MQEVGATSTSISVGCQTDAHNCREENIPEANILVCCFINGNEASTQTNIYIRQSPKNERQIVSNIKNVRTISCGPDEVFHGGFSGFSDLKNNETMAQLGGISLQFFSVLLNLVIFNEAGQPHFYRSLNKENRLLLFLMKMKLGISFSALGALFNVHRTTASKFFFQILTGLTEKTKTWIFWPSKESVKKNLPASFHKYPNCRCIIDCTEIFTETPPTVEQRVLMYSNYKSRFTVKYLVVITPDGFFCKLSKGYGGRATDSFITNDSGFLELIEPGDTVLADKGFPQIKSELLKREAVLVIPPFAFDPQFSHEDVEETYKIASVRIHVERAIQRIKLCNILQMIPIELLPHIDAIMHMCCIIANSKTPLIHSN